MAVTSTAGPAHEYIPRLDVAVNDPCGVGPSDGVANCAERAAEHACCLVLLEAHVPGQLKKPSVFIGERRSHLVEPGPAFEPSGLLGRRGGLGG